jgi:hypothetical protein
MLDPIVVVTALTGAGLLWHAVTPRLARSAVCTWAVSDLRPDGVVPTSGLYVWPALGRFEFEVIDTDRHQSALQTLLAQQGELCKATLHASKEVGGRVEVRIDRQRVGFLEDGDASRFQRRLAYECRAGQTSQCDARLVERRAGQRTQVVVLLDLKPFRH